MIPSLISFLARVLAAVRSHQAWGSLGVLVYACAVTFPHQNVQNVMARWGNLYTLPRIYQISATIGLILAAVMTVLLLAILRGQESRRGLTFFWFLTFALILSTWRLFTANNTELVHYPQYFPEGMAILALTASPAEALAWIVFFGGLDEAFQYTFLLRGLPLPYDFNDIYMDLLGGATGVIFGMAVLGVRRKTDVTGWTGKILKKPGVILIGALIAAGILLRASGKMLLFEAPGSPSHWFSLSRLKTPSFWYFNQRLLGPHHIHELTPIEGPALIILTIALYSLLDRTFTISETPSARPHPEIARTGR